MSMDVGVSKYGHADTHDWKFLLSRPKYCSHQINCTVSTHSHCTCFLTCRACLACLGNNVSTARGGEWENSEYISMKWVMRALILQCRREWIGLAVLILWVSHLRVTVYKCIDSRRKKANRECCWVALAWSDPLLLLLDLTRKEPLRHTYVETALLY